MKITFQTQLRPHIFCLLIFCLSNTLYGFMPASQEIKIKQLTTTPSFKSNALWCNYGFGMKLALEGMFLGTISANVRLNRKVFSFGYEGIRLNECNFQDGYFLTIGLSHYGSWQDIILSTGVSLIRTTYDDDMSDYSSTSESYFGLLFKFQSLFHLPLGPGAGFSLDMNLNKHASYLMLTFNVNLGVWIL